MAARYIQFATNEYTLYGGQDSPRDTFMCPELLNTIVVREPRARLMSHLHYMLPMLVEIAGTDAAFRPGGGASTVAGWDAAAPFVFDNYLTRSLLGEAVFRSPVGSLREAAARFWADDMPATTLNNATASNTAATNPAAGRTEGAQAAGGAATAAAASWANKLASAARLMLQQFDVVMALEDGTGNRPHFKRGLGWPYPVDIIHKRVGSEAKIKVDVGPLLPPDLEVMLQRHTLDTQVYQYGQLFSKLDLVVWDTAARMEAQACPGGSAAARGGLVTAVTSRAAMETLTRRATRIERRLHSVAADPSSDGTGADGDGVSSEVPAWFKDFSGSAKTVAGQAGSPSDFPPLLTPPLRRLLADQDALLAELGSSVDNGRDRSSGHGSSSISSSSRKLLKVLASGVAIGGVQHRYAPTNVLSNPTYLTIVGKVLALEQWNVTQAVRQGLRQLQQPGQQGLQQQHPQEGQHGQQGQGQQLQPLQARPHQCTTVAAASWGSITGTCGWVGVKLWASSLHARGQLVV